MEFRSFRKVQHSCVTTGAHITLSQNKGKMVTTPKHNQYLFTCCKLADIHTHTHAIWKVSWGLALCVECEILIKNRHNIKRWCHAKQKQKKKKKTWLAFPVKKGLFFQYNTLATPGTQYFSTNSDVEHTELRASKMLIACTREQHFGRS